MCFLAHQLILQAQRFFSVTYQQPGSPNTTGFLALVRSVPQLFPAAQFHLAWNELGGACPCPAPPAALWFSLTWRFLSKISSADQSGAQWLPGASQQSGIRNIAVVLALSSTAGKAARGGAHPAAPGKPLSTHMPAGQLRKSSQYPLSPHPFCVKPYAVIARFCQFIPLLYSTSQNAELFLSFLPSLPTFLAQHCEHLVFQHKEIALSQ